eukprot:7543641-Pyramimonas_sp.AAC.1
MAQHGGSRAAPFQHGALAADFLEVHGQTRELVRGARFFCARMPLAVLFARSKNARHFLVQIGLSPGWQAHRAL